MCLYARANAGTMSTVYAIMALTFLPHCSVVRGEAPPVVPAGATGMLTASPSKATSGR